uniref:Uncharacterized protein n=1 Tax=Oryza brachyantha TaxID=4533 RepID=J3NBB0_ORYBR
MQTCRQVLQIFKGEAACEPLPQLVHDPLHPSRHANGRHNQNNNVCRDTDDQCQDVRRRRHPPAASGGVGAHQAKQVQYHGGVQRQQRRPGVAHPLDQQQHHYHQRRHEGGRVAVEEDLVATRIAAQKNGVAGGVDADLALVPEAARRAHRRLVGDGRRGGGGGVFTFLQLPAAKAPMSPTRSRITHTRRAYDRIPCQFHDLTSDKSRCTPFLSRLGRRTTSAE